MIKEFEKQIRNLQKELAEVQKGQAALRLQPCRGDSEIREKDGKLEELDRRAKTISETIRDLEGKRQSLMAESTMRENSCS
jgi:chromosome segregation ATPase